MAKYNVVFRPEECHNSADCDELDRLSGEPMTLEEVSGICAAFSVSAHLYDAAGFRRGSVEPDGDWRLQ